MKRAIQHLAVVLVAMLVVSVAVAEPVEFKRYNVEKLLVKYKINGSQKGVEELGFDRYGLRERKRTIVQTMGTESNTLVLINGDDMYTIDEKLKMGDRIDTPMVKELEAQGETNMTALAAKMMTDMGGKVVRKEAVLGREADVWVMPSMGATVWIWNGVALKTMTNMGGVQLMIEAYEIIDDPTFSDSDFVPRSDVKITDQGSMEQLMQKSQQQQQQQQQN